MSPPPLSRCQGGDHLLEGTKWLSTEGRCPWSLGGGGHGVKAHSFWEKGARPCLADLCYGGWWGGHSEFVF